MQITAPPIPFYRAASNRPPELSSAAAVRLRLLEQWRAIRAEGATAARAADILHVPRANLYRWQARLDERGLRGLEPGSRRPRNSRKPQRDPALVKAVLALREKPPCYGKDKTAVVLRKDGWAVSASMAGRILSDAKRRGIIREPPRPGVRRRNPKPQAPLRRPKAQRLPAYPPRRPRPSRHAGRPPSPRRGPQAFHGAGRRLPLRRPAGGDAGDLRERRAIPRRHRCAHALPGQCYPSGRGLRVPRGV